MYVSFSSDDSRHIIISVACASPHMSERTALPHISISIVVMIPVLRIMLMPFLLLHVIIPMLPLLISPLRRLPLLQLLARRGRGGAEAPPAATAADKSTAESLTAAAAGKEGEGGAEAPPAATADWKLTCC